MLALCYTTDMEQAPNQRVERDEFDIFSVPDTEINQNNACQMLGVAAGMASGWGRDSSELREILQLQNEVHAGTTDPVIAIHRVRAIFRERQDYN